MFILSIGNWDLLECWYFDYRNVGILSIGAYLAGYGNVKGATVNSHIYFYSSFNLFFTLRAIIYRKF